MIKSKGCEFQIASADSCCWPKSVLAGDWNYSRVVDDHKLCLRSVMSNSCLLNLVCLGP